MYVELYRFNLQIFSKPPDVKAENWELFAIILNQNSTYIWPQCYYNANDYCHCLEANRRGKKKLSAPKIKTCLILGAVSLPQYKRIMNVLMRRSRVPPQPTRREATRPGPRHIH